ncbi:MAG TPA: CopD family protein [Steroidobacteraceae bacterium]|nr:CopD family protein [Steroidobacteraceae bacterium]
MPLLYVKATHILFIISWMAGIFYLPRIFVHYVEGKTAGEDIRRLKVMARRLYHFTSVMAVFALASGLWLWLGFGFAGGWIHAKLTMVMLLIAYHISARVYMKRMQRDAALPGATALRWYNELPLLILVVILWLVVVKPF